MKLFLMILPCLLMTAAYEDINDNYLQKLTENKELFRKHIECVIEQSPCDEFGKRAKAHIMEVLSDNCRECDDVQKHMTHTIIKAMKTDFPELYDAFEDMYDPDRTLVSKLDEKIKNYWK